MGVSPYNRKRNSCTPNHKLLYSHTPKHLNSTRMTEILSYITWNPDAEIFRIGGFAVRWYSMCWLVGLALAYFLVRKLYIE